MRVIVKLLIAALILHGVFRVGVSYWHYYQFEDALQEIAQFGERRSDRQLCAQALESASSLDIDIAADGVAIRRGGNPWFNCLNGFQQLGGGPGVTDSAAAKIFIEAHYAEGLRVLPGYSYPWEFKPSVMAWVRP